jgi:hypothetical protein
MPVETMPKQSADDQLPDDEAEKRFKATLKAAIATPPLRIAKPAKKRPKKDNTKKTATFRAS